MQTFDTIIIGSGQAGPSLAKRLAGTGRHVAIIERGRIIDIDTPQRLVDRHCPERTVVLATSDAAAEERFRTIPRIESVVRSDLQFTIRGRGDDLVTEVIHCLSESRIRVTDFRMIVPNLEDVFLKLTGRSIRD